ncbi:Phenylalanyl-tRNA synthetase beta chain [Pseudonocardia dioxanivorans CB1190]|uniref:Phenylalanine--tRNA ligase beta subunit n=1 Tax=Pseudonocardia dioxanivorans (strain ATCC 55486 / DSM 44775 / JCM 13855 / CB1190) TaxID=675635 RepID=F4CLG5_PSEUX|nr:phenylalanine--tRNA ligase subunit beta [Pseudonocardia dioxanivorans]AEA26007.1 Phenylalanyl-tRNA synthetase beta chain [Pseudonocardia dioxanivorans CB1190]
MRVPVSWLADHVEGDLPADADEIGEAFVRVGLEIEDVHRAEEITGPLVVGRVLEITELTEFKKPIRYCRVDVGDEHNDPAGEDPAGGTGGGSRGIVCGARNFVVGDLVVVALPGSVLPGGFAIAARKTYGHVSDGMIASARELGIGSDHAGILVLPEGTAVPGDDARPVLGIDDPVIELNVTPDRGYCFSVRGLARELAASLGRDFTDPAARVAVPAEAAESWPVRLDDAEGCPRFVARRVTGVDPNAPSPWWLRRRLLAAGMRPISLTVDVTNYVMIELGQPLHAYDASRLQGPIVVRRARAGEKLRTLDDAERALDPDDLLITDDSGPIGLAGVMGGASTEIPETHEPGATIDVLIEAAHFDPATIARGARRHKLPSEASRRFERAVDAQLPPVAAERAAQLLVEHGGGTIVAGRTDVGAAPVPAPVRMALDLPDRTAGVAYARGATVQRLTQIGATVELETGPDGKGVVVATPPSWRPDLAMAADLVEEVLRLEGLDVIPSVLPSAPAGRGLTAAQRRRRAVSRALAEAGYVEVLPFPFVGDAVWDAFGLAADDVRRRTVTVVNPLDAERGSLATTLLPGLLDAVVRNRSRGLDDVALFHVGQVVLPHAQPVAMPEPGVRVRPSAAEYAQIDAALPAQPQHVAVVLAGEREPRGWWGPGREAGWADAVEAARLVGRVAGVELRVTKGELAPFHPGRTAVLRVGDFPVGHAGELHPKVVEALGLPPRTCAMELDLDLVPLTDPRPVPRVSPYPPVAVDVALVTPDDVPVADVADALEEGGGELLEEVRLFDVYSGAQVGEGRRSLAFSLRFRADDRTLTSEEANAARDAAVALAGSRTGAELRG